MVAKVSLLHLGLCVSDFYQVTNPVKITQRSLVWRQGNHKSQASFGVHEFQARLDYTARLHFKNIKITFGFGKEFCIDLYQLNKLTLFPNQ
jgi:hypothetical protein